jgi:hypothetical protein
MFGARGEKDQRRVETGWPAYSANRAAAACEGLVAENHLGWDRYTSRSCRFGPIRKRGSGCRDEAVYQVEEAGGEGGMRNCLIGSHYSAKLQ